MTSINHLALIELVPRWAPGVAWPRAFRRAAATVLAIGRFGSAHASAAARARTGLWSLSSELISLVVEKAAGRQAEWIEVSAETGAAAEATCWGVPVAALTSDVVQRPLAQLHWCKGVLFEPDCPVPTIEPDPDILFEL